jgi:glycosyltransferase involved in cell wall biosynthesis
MNGQPIKFVYVTTVPESLSFFIGQVSYLKARGMEVHAVSSSGPLLDRFIEAERIPVHLVEMGRRISPGTDICAVVKMYRIFRGLRPDIVQAQTPKAALVGIVAAWLAGTPVRIYNIIGLRLLTTRALQRFLLTSAERICCRLATQLLCASHSLRNVFVAQKLCPAHKIKVLGNGSVNGIDSQRRFNPRSVSSEQVRAARTARGIPEGAVVLGFVGRVVRDKGVVELARAWRVLRSEFTQVHLMIIGPRESEDPIPEDIWQVLSSDSRVHVTGHIGNEELPVFFAAMDLLILPSYREGFPFVPLEAASMEVPVVATRVPGCIDAISDGVTGLLIEPRNTAELAHAIRQYLVDPELRRRHGSNGRARVIREFAQEPLWNCMYQEYIRLLTASNDGVQ